MPIPWKEYGELRGLKAPPRRNLAPAAFTCSAARKDLLARFHRARAGHDHDLFAADLDAVGEADDGAFRPEAAAGQLVGRRDADALRRRRAALRSPL